MGRDTERLIGTAIEVHREVGPGRLESIAKRGREITAFTSAFALSAW